MDEEHEVPVLKIEPMVDMPLLRIPIPRSLALGLGGALILLLFLGSQGVSWEILMVWVLPAAVGLALAYYFVRPENMRLDGWVRTLWEYTLLPRYLLWHPSGAGPAPDEEGRAGADVDDLWGTDHGEHE